MSEEHRSDDTASEEVKTETSNPTSDSKDSTEGAAPRSEAEGRTDADSASVEESSEPKNGREPSIPPRSIPPRGSLPPDDDEYEYEEETSTAWKVGLWVLCVLFGVAMIYWGGSTIYATVRMLRLGAHLIGTSVLRVLVSLAQIVGGAAILIPRFRFSGSIVLAVAAVVNMFALRPYAIPARSWFYMNAMLIVLAGVIVLKSLPPALAARFRKDDEDEPPPVF